MPVSSPSPQTSAFPADLIRLSAKVEARRAAKKLLQPPWHTEQTLSDGEYHGAQLMPLRTRDLSALAKLFEQDDIEAIEEDVSMALALLWPEPVWGDDPFDLFDDSSLDFLAEFL
ncbi:MAG: hypothetical protein AAGA60_12925 [Cyanobacteria bacterium P01_E01_bin.42]